jgi:DnaJ-class molecular chaperone
MSKICQTCRGQKKIQGMGWMECECPKCNGVGRVMDIEEPSKNDEPNSVYIDSVIDEPAKKKTWSRKKKVKS